MCRVQMQEDAPRFLALKTPLDDRFNDQVEPQDRFTPTMLFQVMTTTTSTNITTILITPKTSTTTTITTIFNIISTTTIISSITPLHLHLALSVDEGA